MADKSPKMNFPIEKIFGKPIERIDQIIADKDSHIIHFTIPKRSGGARNITAPDEELKEILRRLNSTFFRNYSPHPAANGFIRHRNILTNALPHVGKKSLGHMDIKDFFDTISGDMVLQSLFGNKRICKSCVNCDKMMCLECSPSIYHNKNHRFRYKCDELKAAFVKDYCSRSGYQSLFHRVRDICTYEGFTPQGFPTSPFIANIVLKGFDKKMTEIAESAKCAYTRYADDIAFSSNDLSSEQLHDSMFDITVRELWAFGFKVNKSKVMWKDRGRFSICGIVVNKKPNIARRTIRLFRAKIHNAITKHGDRVSHEYIRSLKGWCSYLKFINPVQGEKYLKPLVAFEEAKWKP
jgi:hypothetical protein